MTSHRSFILASAALMGSWAVSCGTGVWMANSFARYYQGHYPAKPDNQQKKDAQQLEPVRYGVGGDEFLTIPLRNGSLCICELIDRQENASAKNGVEHRQKYDAVNVRLAECQDDQTGHDGHKNSHTELLLEFHESPLLVADQVALPAYRKEGFANLQAPTEIERGA
ncbi:hypothetical protein GCM10007863_08600 [Dyella mobilis]|nr:hypothetical protein GCM10007863_08600 [Dyella mobilis]